MHKHALALFALCFLACGSGSSSSSSTTSDGGAAENEAGSGANAPLGRCPFGSVQLSFSYAQFAGLAGGDWASRLSVFRLEDCEATGEDQCRWVELDGVTNDLTTSTTPTATRHRLVWNSTPASQLGRRHTRAARLGVIPSDTTGGVQTNSVQFTVDNDTPPSAFIVPITTRAPDKVVTFSANVLDPDGAVESQLVDLKLEYFDGATWTTRHEKAAPFDVSAVRTGFGAATWPHQLVRIMLLEQIYRAVTILSGHPYHRD